MELLFVPVPLLDKNKTVAAYMLRYRLTNQGDCRAAGAPSPLRRLLEEGGAEQFGGGHPIFIPVQQDVLESGTDLFVNCPQTTVFLLESVKLPVTEKCLAQIRILKNRGYRFGVMQQDGFIDASALMDLCDYVFLTQKVMRDPEHRAYVGWYKKLYKDIRVIASGMNDEQSFQQAVQDGFQMFEGMFYHAPVTRKKDELPPVKANMLLLLNLVRDEQFEFSAVADVVRRDTALSYSLMRFINSPYLGLKHKVKSIQHAVTMLGQVEVRKWVTAAVFKGLGTDRPGELTRISLMRAKFAEDLAGKFGLEEERSSLFLMGLFSTLDAMLDTTLEDALSYVRVSDDIADALIHQTGRYQAVYQFVLAYERADWVNIMESCKAHALTVPEVCRTYFDAFGWYHELWAPRLHQDSGRRGPIAPARSL